MSEFSLYLGLAPVGFVAGLESVKGAISDGTRNGSSECARVLESYKRLGVTGDDEE